MRLRGRGRRDHRLDCGRPGGIHPGRVDCVAGDRTSGLRRRRRRSQSQTYDGRRSLVGDSRRRSSRSGSRRRHQGGHAPWRQREEGLSADLGRLLPAHRDRTARKAA